MFDLETLTRNGSPQQIRRRMLQELMEAVGADRGMFSQLLRASEGSGLLSAGMLAIGPPTFVAAYEASDGTRLADLDLDLGDMAAINTFDLRQVEDIAPAVRDAYWAPMGVGSGLLMIAARGGTVLGHIGLLRSEDQPRFTKDDLAKANRAARATRLVLEAADAREPTGLLPNGAYVFDDRGELMFRSHATQDDDAIVTALCEQVRLYARGEHPGDAVVGHHRLTMERLESEDGFAILVTATEVSAATLADPLKLSPLKRRIASYAVRGATVPEIARAIDRSPETVRAHIKQIYQRLGISSRVELAETCRSFFA